MDLPFCGWVNPTTRKQWIVEAVGRILGNGLRYKPVQQVQVVPGASRISSSKIAAELFLESWIPEPGPVTNKLTN